MIVKRLRLTNFLAHENREFTFNQPIIVICGNNGKGKSSIFQAITLALFKQQERGNLDDLITYGKDWCEVELEFVIGDDNYLVRYEKKRSQTPVHTLSKNNQVITETTTATVNYIKSLLNVDYDGLVSSVFSPQGKLGYITGLKPDARKEVLSTFLGIGALLKTSAKARDIRYELTTKKERVKGMLDVTNAQLQGIRKQLESPATGLEQKICQLTREYDEVVQQIERNAQSAATSQKLVQIEKTITNTKSMIDRLLAEMQTIQSLNLQELESSYNKLGQEKSAIQKNKQEFIKSMEEAYKNVLKIRTQVESIESSIKRISQLSQCPTCFRSITDDDKKWLVMKMTDNKSNLTAQLEQWNSAYLEAQKKVTELDQKVGQLEKQLSDISTLVNKARVEENYKKALQQLYTQYAEQKVQFDQLKQQVKDFDPVSYQVLLQKKVHIQNDLESAKAKIAARKVNEETEKKLKDDLTRYYNSLLYYTNEVNDYKLIEDAYSEQGIITHIIKKTVWKIETLTNRILSLLSPGLSVSLLVDQKHLDVQVSTQKATILYEQCSGGERSKVDLALRLALAILMQNSRGGKLQTLFIDEATANMDTEGRQNFIEVLKFLQSFFKRILIITHQDDMKESFSRIEL